MTTLHKLIVSNSVKLPIADESVNLIVTSPPYPMIAMWDKLFCELNRAIAPDLTNDGMAAYAKMHDILDGVWRECNRVLKDSGIVCINIGDATRTINSRFGLYANHSRIIRTFEDMGYTILPPIIWQKLSNTPTKFMGSGMLPTGAYVTQEHEYILIMRKGPVRQYNKDERKLRHESAYFYEERNAWFTDIWRIRGEGQRTKLKGIRECKAAYPFEIPYRLINMFSLKGDTVLDTFNGTGTTMLAAMASERHSIGVDIDMHFLDYVKQRSVSEFDTMNKRIQRRYDEHIAYMANINSGIDSTYHNFRVKTPQERDILLNVMDELKWYYETARVTYKKLG